MSFETGGVEREPGNAPGVGFTIGNPVGSFVETVGKVVVHPIDFFSRLTRQGDYLSPLIFAVIVYEISAILGGIVGIVIGNTGIGGFIATLILTPIFAVIGLFIVAGILHLLVMLFVGSANSGYEATFRVGAYASVTSLVGWIPFIGPILGLYSIVLSILGIRELHETTTGRAALVVLIPTIVILVIVVLIAIVVGIAIFAASR